MRNRDNDAGWNDSGWRGERDRAGSTGGSGESDARGRGGERGDRDRHVDRGIGGYAAGGRDWSSNEGRGAFGDREDARYDRYRNAGGAGPSGASPGMRPGGPFGAYDEGYGIYGAGGRANAEDDPAWPWSGAQAGGRYEGQGQPMGRQEANAFPPPGYGRSGSQGQAWGPSGYERARTDWSAGPYVDPTRRAYGSRDAAPRTGRGPKGYTRSDERIREDVIERIIDNGLDASDLEIDVKGGEVTLAGTVHQRLYKHRIEDIAASVSGARDVHNHIRVKPLPEDVEEREAEVMNPDAPPTPTMNVRRAAIESAGTHKS